MGKADGAPRLHALRVAQGGDVGAAVHGRRWAASQRDCSASTSTCSSPRQILVARNQLPAQSEAGTCRARRGKERTYRGDGFRLLPGAEGDPAAEQIGYSSCWIPPVGLAAWLLDHDTDSYYKSPARSSTDEPVGNLTRDNILDNITLYWLTGTGALGRPVVMGDWTGAGERLVQAARRLLQVSVPCRISRRSGRGSSLLRAVGSRWCPPISITSTKSTRVATSPPGKSRSCSLPICGPRSLHCARPLLFSGTGAMSILTTSTASSSTSSMTFEGRVSLPTAIFRRFAPSQTESRPL